MFDQLLGLPAHPLLVHAVVVFVPLLVLASVAYVLLPFARYRLGWVLVLLAVVAPVSAWFAKESGERFKAKLIAVQNPPPGRIQDITVHQEHGTNLLWFVCGLTAAVLLFQLFDAGRRRAAANAGAPSDAGPAPLPAARGRMIILVVLGIAVLALAAASAWYVYRTGDTGAHLVYD